MWFVLWSVACGLMGMGVGFILGAGVMVWLHAPLRHRAGMVP